MRAVLALVLACAAALAAANTVTLNADIIRPEMLGTTLTVTVSGSVADDGSYTLFLTPKFVAGICTVSTPLAATSWVDLVEGSADAATVNIPGLTHGCEYTVGTFVHAIDSLPCQA